MDHSGQRGAQQRVVGGMNATLGSLDSQQQRDHSQREPLRSPIGSFTHQGPAPSAYSRPFSPLPPTFGPYAALSVTENGDLRQAALSGTQQIPSSLRGQGGAHYYTLPEPNRLGTDAGGQRTPARLLPPLDQNAWMTLSNDACPGRPSLPSTNLELASIRQRSLADILQSGSGLYPAGSGPLLTTESSSTQPGSHNQSSNPTSPRRRVPPSSSWTPYRPSRSDAPSRFESRGYEHGAPTSPPPSVDRRRSRYHARARRTMSLATETSVAAQPGLEATNQSLFMVGRQLPVSWDDERDQALELSARVRAPRVPHTGKIGAFKARLQSLQAVAIDDLLIADRNCSICYNPFCEKGPEGITETPVRLPHCGHVFGDHCIKRWFADSDKCPYCRVKVPGVKKDKETGLSDSMIQGLERIRQDSLQNGLLPPGYHGVRFVPTLMARDRFPRHGRLRTPPSDAEDGHRRTRQRLDSTSPDEEDEIEGEEEDEEGELHDPAPPYISEPTDEPVSTPPRADSGNMYNDNSYFGMVQVSASNNAPQNSSRPPRAIQSQQMSFPPLFSPNTRFIPITIQPSVLPMSTATPESPGNIPSPNQGPAYQSSGLSMNMIPASHGVPVPGPPPQTEHDNGGAFFETRPAMTFVPPPPPVEQPPELRPANNTSTSPLHRDMNDVNEHRQRMW